MLRWIFKEMTVWRWEAVELLVVKSAGFGVNTVEPSGYITGGMLSALCIS